MSYPFSPETVRELNAVISAADGLTYAAQALPDPHVWRDSVTGYRVRVDAGYGFIRIGFGPRYVGGTSGGHELDADPFEAHGKQYGGGQPITCYVRDSAYVDAEYPRVELPDVLTRAGAAVLRDQLDGIVSRHQADHAEWHRARLRADAERKRQDAIRKRASAAADCLAAAEEAGRVIAESRGDYSGDRS